MGPTPVQPAPCSTAGKPSSTTPPAAQTRLLIIDPLAAAFVQNENDRALVRAFLSALDQWAEDHSCAVLIISHPPKGDSAQSGSHRLA